MKQPVQSIKVLFLCTHNSARSQMAEGLLRYLTGNTVEVYSAGTIATYLRTEAIEVMDEIGIDIRHQSSKRMDKFLNDTFDFVITVCDSANESCPIFAYARNRWHWSIEDPSREHIEDSERLNAFREARDRLKDHIEQELLPQLENR